MFADFGRPLKLDVLAISPFFRNKEGKLSPVRHKTNKTFDVLWNLSGSSNITQLLISL